MEVDKIIWLTGELLLKKKNASMWNGSKCSENR